MKIITTNDGQIDDEISVWYIRDINASRQSENLSKVLASKQGYRDCFPFSRFSPLLIKGLHEYDYIH